MQNLFIKATLMVGLTVGASLVANAELVTSNTFTSPLVIDFSTQATVVSESGPVQIGNLVGQDVTVQTIDGTTQLYTNFNGWFLVNNGSWGAPQTYISANATSGMRYAFNGGAVAQVGGFLNYARGGTVAPLTITARDSSLNILETYDINNLADIVTPGALNGGAFRGISRPTADIAFFDITGLALVLDNLTFSVAAAAPPGNGSSPSTVTAVPTLPLYGLVVSALGVLLVASRWLREAAR